MAAHAEVAVHHAEAAVGFWTVLMLLLPSGRIAHRQLVQEMFPLIRQMTCLKLNAEIEDDIEL